MIGNDPRARHVDTDMENKTLNRLWMSPEANAIVDRYQAMIGSDALYFGPGHIALADPNVSDDDIDGCIESCDDREAWWLVEGVRTDEEIETVRACLIELRAMPEYDRWNHEYRINDLIRDLETDDYAEYERIDMERELRRRLGC